MKIYLNHTTTDRSNKASDAMAWHRAGDLVQVLTYDNMGKELSDIMIHPAPAQAEKSRLDQNTAHCKHIADECNAYVSGEVRRCPECGEEIRREDWPEVFKCPECGAVSDPDDWAQLSIWDFLQDTYDVEFRTNGKKADDLQSVRIMVACGGPNIYLDTATKDVELYWWSERARWPLSYTAVEALDDWAAEYWGCL